MNEIIKIREGIDEYYMRTGHNPSKIIITKYVLNKIKSENKLAFNLPRLKNEKDRLRDSVFKICGIPIRVIYGNSTAITYE